MTDPNSHASASERYCVELIRDHDEDFMLSSRYALADDAERMRALFALQIELRRIPRLVSEAPLGEIRLQWFREALDEAMLGVRPRAHPVIETLTAAKAVNAYTRPLMERLIDSRARLLYDPSFASLDDFRSFMRDAEAPLARIAAGEGAANAAELEEIGEAYALARYAPLLAPALAKAACAAARDAFATLSRRAGSLKADLVGRMAFLTLARGYAARPAGGEWPLAKRLAVLRCVATGRL
ncbi:MAG: squalene/phytoene synthase family protein [Parvularculaceae bacterium]